MHILRLLGHVLIAATAFGSMLVGRIAGSVLEVNAAFLPVSALAATVLILYFRLPQGERLTFGWAAFTAWCALLVQAFLFVTSAAFVGLW